MKHPFFFIARHGVYPAFCLCSGWDPAPCLFPGGTICSRRGGLNLPYDIGAYLYARGRITYRRAFLPMARFHVVILNGGHPHPILAHHEKVRFTPPANQHRIFYLLSENFRATKGKALKFLFSAC